MTSDRMLTTMRWNDIPATPLERNEALLNAQLSVRHREDLGMPRMRGMLNRFAHSNLSAAPITASIADIHGNVDGLRQELTFIKGQNIRNLVCTGDLIDRDPNSIAVINELKAAQAHFDLKVVIGNHDLFFLRAMNGSRRDLMTWLGNGGMAVLSEIEVGLDHWNRYAENEASNAGLQPLKWIRGVLRNKPEVQEQILKHIQSNDCLNEVAAWMRMNQRFCYMNEIGILYIHAGIPTHPDGTQALEYTSNGVLYTGLWAIAKAEEEFFAALEAKLQSHPAYAFLEHENSIVWIRDWENGSEMSPVVCQKLLDSLASTGIAVGHSVLTRAKGIHHGSLIMNDRGLARAYLNQPAVVIHEPGLGSRCITTSKRELGSWDLIEQRAQRARGFARQLLAQMPGPTFDENPTIRFDDPLN